MSSTQIAVLGAVAGLTIFIGLPVGRLRSPAQNLKAALNGIAIGVLIFLLWDILAHAWEPTDAALAEHDWSAAAVTGGVLALGLVVGMMALVRFDRGLAARRGRSASPGTGVVRPGP